MKKFPGHLHIHTEYSPLDGLCKIEELITTAKELGQNFIAITDHGSSSGLYEASELGKKHNFKVLLGEEFYFENPKDLKNGHLILIAKNENGLKNLFKLQHMALKNVYYKPRINLDMLKECNKGLICTTACVANQINQFILKNEKCLALAHIVELKKIFGDDLYIELQSSINEDVIKVNKVLEEFCIEYNLKPILTNDVHYVKKNDYFVHEVLLCIQQVKKLSDDKRWKFKENDYWLKSQSEMEKDIKYLSESTINTSYDNLQEIADKCKEGLSLKAGNYLPKFYETKEEEDNELYNLVWKNYLKGRLHDRNECNESFKQDLFKELKVISETGYSGYFLIVHEYINWAKKNGIAVGDGRGSGAGCKVAYTIGITEVNPQKHDLLFERFLTPGREPDFDVDFSDINAVFKHLQDVYGKDNVARVGAFGRLTAKAAIRKVMSVFGYNMKEISSIIDLLPNRISFTLKEAMNENKELVKFFNDKQDMLNVIKRLEGVLDHMSTHAGGVIICKGLNELLPLMNDKDDNEKLIVALDKKQLEKLGHYKFDVLGLKSLILMANTMKYVNINWNEVDFNDCNVYNMLCKGDVLGVFQLSEQRDKVVKQQPKCFEDLIAINALIRPGVCDWNEYINARKNNVSSDLKYMNCTHGLIVYQDQYLQLAQTYAGWDIAFSDKHIRKNKDILNDVELKEKWKNDTGGSKEMMELWDMICKIVSQGYGFNRAHSTSYARLSFQTAYLKLYYPEIFYAAYMTQNVDDSVKISELINELKSKNIEIVPPNINNSLKDYLPEKNKIIMPLTSIKGIGNSVIEEIERLRPITSIEEFLENRTKRKLKSNNFENLIKAGTFSDFGSRNELLKKYTLCDSFKQDYYYDKEMFGFYLSKSPFDKYESIPFAECNGNIMSIVMFNDIKERLDKKGNKMAFAVAQNSKDTIKTIIFSSVWNKYNIEEDKLYFIKGKIDKGNLLLNYVEEIEQ